MTRSLLLLDRLVAVTRPAWVGLGQLGLAVLGVHLAADRLDDHLYQLLVWLNGPLSALLASVGWSAPEAESLVAPAAWCALGLELLVDLHLLSALTLSEQQPVLSWAAWRQKLSVEALVLPLFWAPVALAGAWVVGMAVEDLLAPWNPPVALALGCAVALLAAWRLGWSGWRRVVGGLDEPKRRVQGLAWAPLLLALAALAAWHGLPIWGWLA